MSIPNKYSAGFGFGAVLAIILATAASAEPLCDTSEFRMDPDYRYHEEEFTNENAEANLMDLKTLIPDWIDTRRENGHEIDLRSGELSMAYFNRVNSIHGYILRQQALVEQENGDPGENTAAFCDFLSKVSIID